VPEFLQSRFKCVSIRVSRNNSGTECLKTAHHCTSPHITCLWA